MNCQTFSPNSCKQRKSHFTALHSLHTARNSTFLISTFLVCSTSFPQASSSVDWYVAWTVHLDLCLWLGEWYFIWLWLSQLAGWWLSRERDLFLWPWSVCYAEMTFTVEWCWISCSTSSSVQSLDRFGFQGDMTARQTIQRRSARAR